jgi:GntR family transcriptional regulator
LTDTPTPHVDLTHNRAPLYVQLSTLFRRFIVSGQWVVGSQIPTHEDLAVQFEVNPATIRKAIALLEKEGLVERFRPRGTFVKAKPAAVKWVEIPSEWDAALHAYDELTPDIIEAHDEDGYRLLRRLYRRGREPIAIEECSLAHSLRRHLGDAELAETPSLRLLARPGASPMGPVEETVRFGIADGEIAAALRLPLNAPLAIMHISARDSAGTLVLESRAYFRGDIARLRETIRFD